MNIAVRNALTVDEYLAWTQAQDNSSRTELINGQVVAMSPERAAHNLTKISVLLALKEAMARTGVTGQVFTDGMTVPIDQHTAYEPDALVRCGAPLPRDEMKVIDPLVVVEVRSPSTAHMDTSAKLIGYFKLPSVRHYLFIDPDARTVTIHTRVADGSIVAHTISAGKFVLDPPGLEIEAGDLFA